MLEMVIPKQNEASYCIEKQCEINEITAELSDKSDSRFATMAVRFLINLSRDGA